MKYNVYKIIRNDGMIYIGSTNKPINYRLSQHDYETNRMKSKIAISFKEHGKESHKIYIIKRVDTKEEATLEELKQIMLYDSVRNGLNSYYPLSKNIALSVAIDIMRGD